MDGCRLACHWRLESTTYVNMLYYKENMYLLQRKHVFITKKTSLYYKENMSSRVSRYSEALASEILKEMFLR